MRHIRLTRPIRLIGLVCLVAVLVASFQTARARLGQQSGGSPASGSEYSSRQPRFTGGTTGTGLVGYWPMDGDATDQSGVLKNNLTENNTVTQADGKNGKAAQFTAANGETLSVVDNASLRVSNTSFTITGWVYLNNLTDYQALLTKGDASVASGEYRLSLYNQRMNFCVRKADNTGAICAGVNDSQILSTENWHLITAWYDYSSGTVAMSVDDNTPLTNSMPGGVYSGINNLVMGYRNAYLDGRIDSVGFWKRTLSTDERAALYDSGNGMAYRDLSNNLKNKLVSYWDFEEPSGTRLDSHSHGNDGTVTGATLTDGKFGQAYSYDSASYISIPNATSLQFDDKITVAAWIKANTLSGWSSILQGTNSASWSASYWIGCSSSSSCRWSINGDSSHDFNPGNLQMGTWYHIAGVYDGTKAYFYVNASEKANFDRTGNIGSEDGLRIGRNQNGYPFNGMIDDVRVYNRTLSASEISDMYKGSNPPSVDQTAVGYWNLDETSGNTVRDATLKNANNLAENGTGGVTQAVGIGGTGKSAQFTAAESDYLSIADNPSLSTGDIDFTVSTWIYFDTLPSVAIVLSKDNNAGGNREYNLAYYSSRLNFEVFDGTLNSVGKAIANNYGDLSTGTWYHVVAWHDSVANQVGIEINETAPNIVATTGAPADATAPFRIAGDSASGRYFNGRIADVGFWRRTLTADERTSLYNSGNGKSYGALTSGEKASLVSYWNLDEASGTRKDSHAGTGLITGATSGEGIYGGGYGFNKSSDYISVGNYPVLDVSNNFSFEAWIKPTAAELSASSTNIIRKENAYAFGIWSGALRLYMGIGTGWGGSVVSNFTFSPDQWYRVAATYNGTTARLFVNGRQTGQANVAVPSTTAAIAQIGRRDSGSEYFGGQIDDVRIYNRALADYEIYDQYLAGKSGR